jgi:hypothetical protein
MTKRLATLASLCLLALGIAAFTGSALAGNGNGNQAASETAPGNSENAPGHNKDSTTAQGSADQNVGTQAGVKPTNATAKGNKPTMCSTGGGQGSSATCTATGSNAATAQTAAKPDQSKRYGNDSTAAQIANSRGAPSGTQVFGPGNSQPHKVLDCKRQHWVDVHAVKSYTTNCSATTSASTSGTTHSTAGSTTAGVSVAASGSAAQGASPTGGVLGVTASGGSSGPVGGVLGAIASAGSGALPFTGFPLWIVVAAGLGLLVLGLTLRSRGRMTA